MNVFERRYPCESGSGCLKESSEFLEARERSKRGISECRWRKSKKRGVIQVRSKGWRVESEEQRMESKEFKSEVN